MFTRIWYLPIILILFVLSFSSQLNDSFAHEDEGDKQVNDRIYTAITNDSPNSRTGVTFYYTAISHSGHNHPWIGEKGVIICDLGTLNPGQSKTCNGPFHSDKSPDGQPECSPASDWDFTFLVSYNEGGNQKSTPLQRGSITSTTGDSGESRQFKWDSHTDQVFSDVACTSPETEKPPPMTAPDPPNPPNVSISNPEGENPTIFGTSAKDTNVKIFISEIGFFGFNFFSIYEVGVDENGNWSITLKGPLENGVYDITAVSIDKKTGLFSKPTDGTIAVDRNPPPQEGTCPTEIEESKGNPSAPFTPLPRINGTTDLDPDLSRSDQGKNDCALIAVTNNLNYFVNTHNIPRGGPNQLPVDNSKIINQLRTDMNWGPDGVVDSDFIAGKDIFVHRYGLPITTTTVDFPTPEQIKKALDEGKAIELNFQFRKPGQTLGHTVAVVGISDTSDGVTIQIHDPMTKGQKTQDSYELRKAQDSKGKEFWLLMNYPHWDGYTILERMFVQEYGGSNQNTSTIPSDSSTPSGAILDDSGPASIPSWIKNNADWWSQGLISDREFATGIGYLIKENIIHVDNIETDPNGDIQIDENISLPDWIKNNAKWWSENSISDNDFKSGIQFMVKEKIIQFKAQKVQRISCPENDFCKSLIDALQNQLPILPSSQVFYAKAEPGTILREDLDLEIAKTLEVPNDDGEYYGFYIDYNPGTKFSHTVAYAWIDLQSMKFDYVYAGWPPVVTLNDQILSYSPSSDYVTIDDVIFQPEKWQLKGDIPDGQKREPVYDVSHKPIATGPAPNSIKPYQKIALLIDFGDNPPRGDSSLDVAKQMAEDADNIKKYLDENGYQTNRVSNYHGNNYPRVDSASDVKNLLKAYSKAFDCDPDVPCGHEFFLYLDGHGSKPFQIKDTGEWIGTGLNIYRADGSGNPDELDVGYVSAASINYILQDFAPCVKIIVFIDSCFGGSLIQDSFDILDKSCENKPCGMTIMAGNSKRESTYVLDGAPTKFLAGSDKDYDGDGVKGDLRDRFEEMKRLQKQDIRQTSGEENPYMADGMDAQLFLCSQDQPLCSLDGPVRMGMNDNVRGVHIAMPTSTSIPTPNTAAGVLDNGNGTYTQIPDSFPPLETKIGFNPVLVPTDVSILPGSEMYNDLRPELSSNNASWLGEKKIDEIFSISDVTFWVETPKLPDGYFYTGKLYPSMSVDGPIVPIGYTNIDSAGGGSYKGSFTFKCYLEGNANVHQLVSLYWQIWKGNNPNDLNSATKITQGIVSSDRESRLNCIGEDTGFVIDPKTTEYYYGWKIDTNIISGEPDYTINDQDLIETDSDNDGISDTKDSCPDKPETVNGFEDLDGCPDSVPEADSDGDGILDSADSCPDKPETVNGFEDSDGCPDSVPETDKTPPKITVPSDITVESTSDTFPVSFSVSAIDDTDGVVTPTCNPSSGSNFPVGPTTVICTASDKAGNIAQESFTVNVKKLEIITYSYNIHYELIPGDPDVWNFYLDVTDSNDNRIDSAVMNLNFNSSDGAHVDELFQIISDTDSLADAQWECGNGGYSLTFQPQSISHELFGTLDLTSKDPFVLNCPSPSE